MPDAQEQLADIPDLAGAHGIHTEADFFPPPMCINAAAGDGDVDMRAPVETTPICVDGAKNANIQRPFASGEKRSPAVVRGEQFFERSWVEIGNHKAD